MTRLVSLDFTPILQEMAKPKSKGGWTFEDLLAAPDELAEIRSLPLLGQDNYLIEGWTNLISAYPRTGKTELLTRLIVEWRALGKDILYITEEPQALWLPRVKQLVWAGIVSQGLGAISFEHAAVYTYEELEALAFASQADIVIVDTIKSIFPLRDERDNSEIVERLKPWLAHFSSSGQTLIMIHHDRKGGGQHGEAIAGDHAFLASFDAVLDITRVKQAENQRRIRAYSRIVQPPDLIYEKVGEEFKVVSLAGVTEPNNLADVMERVLTAMTQEWQTTREVVDGLKPSADGEEPSYEQVRRALLALTAQELPGGVGVERDPPASEDAKGKTVKWRLEQPPTI